MTHRNTTSAAVAVAPDADEQTEVWIEFVNPHDLVLEDNVRTHARLTPRFLKSVREHGVIIPLLAHPDTEGRIVVRDGQRRTLAARETEQPFVPVYVVAEDDERKVRIVQQLITSDHRESLTDAERAEAWHQLTLEGMSVTAISRATGEKPATIKTGLAVVQSETAKTVATDHDVTLDQAAVLLDFEGDDEAIKTLTQTARRRPSDFDHTAQRLKDERAREVARQALIDQLEAEGVPLIDAPRYDDKTIERVTDLQDKDGNRLTVEGYKALTDKPGLVATLNSWGRVPSLTYYVADFRKHGLRKITSAGPKAQGMTEAEKAERKRVVENNRAWESAAKVRRNWLSTFLARKRLPAEAPAVVAKALTTHGGVVNGSLDKGRAVAQEVFLPSSVDGLRDALGALVEANPTKAGHVTLAVVLGTFESSLSKATWRRPFRSNAFYLSTLAGWGYALSDVEQIVVTAYDTPTTNSDDTPTTEPAEAETVEPDEDEADVSNTGSEDYEDVEYEDEAA